LVDTRDNSLFNGEVIPSFNSEVISSFYSKVIPSFYSKITPSFYKVGDSIKIDINQALVDFLFICELVRADMSFVDLNKIELVNYILYKFFEELYYELDYESSSGNDTSKATLNDTHGVSSNDVDDNSPSVFYLEHKNIDGYGFEDKNVSYYSVDHDLDDVLGSLKNEYISEFIDFLDDFFLNFSFEEHAVGIAEVNLPLSIYHIFFNNRNVSGVSPNIITASDGENVIYREISLMSFSAYALLKALFTYIIENYFRIDEFKLNSNTFFDRFNFNKLTKYNLELSTDFNNEFSERLLRTKRVLFLPTYTNITIITNSYDVVHS
jgi:hypothetical protein